MKGKSERAVVQEFGIAREPGRKALRDSLPPSKRKVKRPKMGPSSPGTYAEEAVVGKSLSLVGPGPDKTVIDATGLATGMLVDGLDNPGLKNVVVAGFTLENANFECLLVANAFSVSIWNNHMVSNDKALDPTTGQCTGLRMLSG